MSKQSYTTGQVLTSAQMTQLQANDYNQTVSAKVASYTLVASDAGTRITMSNASATTITVDTSLFSAGDTLIITNIGAGVCTITAGTATVSTGGSLALAQYDSGTLYFTSTGVSIWNGVNPGDITGVTASTGLSGGGTSGTVSLAIDSTVTTLTGTQTLTNKTLTSPALTTPTISTLTTNGDVLYGTGSGALSRLGIGSTGNVLTVASGLPSWAAPSGGGGWTLINSGGTALGSGTTTVSSIPGTYQQLRVWVVAFNPSAIDLVYRMIVNGDTGANYLLVNSSNSTVTNQSFGGTNWQLNINGISNDANTVYNFNEIVFSNYASTTAYKVGQNLNFYRSAAGGSTTNWGLYQSNLAWGSASAITSVGFTTNGVGFTAGTIYVYGVK